MAILLASQNVDGIIWSCALEMSDKIIHNCPEAGAVRCSSIIEKIQWIISPIE
jgi:hypothetical protein